MVVIILLGTLATIASFPIRGALARKRMTRACEAIEWFDTYARTQSKRLRQPVTATIDRSGDRLTVSSPDGRSRVFRLPRNVDLDAMRVLGTNATSTVVFHSDGSSPSYAIRISSDTAEQWVFVAGGSGQVIRGLDPAEALSR